MQGAEHRNIKYKPTANSKVKVKVEVEVEVERVTSYELWVTSV